jgi:hypothetical protein
MATTKKTFEATLYVADGGYDANIELDSLRVAGITKPFVNPTATDRRTFKNLVGTDLAGALGLTNHRFTSGTELRVIGTFSANSVLVNEIRYAGSNKPVRNI